MTKRGRTNSPVETGGAPAVNKEDVGHGVASSSRNDGYARRIKAKISTKTHERNARKTNDGEVTDEGDMDDDDDDDDDVSEVGTSSDKADDDHDDDEETEIFAPFGGASGNAQDPLLSDLRLAASGQTATRQAGQSDEMNPGDNNQTFKRKRTLSEMTAETVLSTIEQDPDEVEYPRKRISRRLSSTDTGLLKYDLSPEAEIDEDFNMDDYAQAIESSSSSEDDEDEEVGYDGISQVDEENESDVEKLEESLIIQEETARLGTNHEGDSVPASQHPGDSDLELPSDIDLGFLNSEMDDIFSAGDSFFFQGLQSDDEYPARKKSDISARKVRFQDEIDIAQDSSSNASTDTDIDIFPDLLHNTFKSQDDLPANLRTQIENDIDVDTANITSSDGEGSCWDFGEEKASENFFSWHDDPESGSDGDNASGSSLSGYDSDGDTTDDDLPPPSTIRAPKSLLHRHSPSTITSEATTPKSFPRSKRSRRGPIMGSFVVDERKAMAFIDPNTKQLRIQRARVPFLDSFNSTASSANNSPQVNFNGMAYDSDTSDFPRLITGPSDVMMSGVFGGMPGQRYEDGRFVMESNGPLLIGPPEAFYPFTSVRTDGTPEDEDEYLTEDEFEDDVDLITAFLDIEEYHEGDEPDLDEDEVTSPTATDAAESTPGHARTKSQSLLDHFDRGVVASFRSHQDRHRHASKLPHDFDQASTPVRSGKTAEEVMTPPRKRKVGGISKGKAPRRLPVMGGFT